MEVVYISERGRCFTITSDKRGVVYTITEPDGRLAPHTGLSLDEAKDVMDIDVREENRICTNLQSRRMIA